ncbi:TrmH family RNA methyltransferase [Pseudobacillus badius]|uniref:TrmH family RNA methyltransferase n=1 Tax=Bacillus badius TaxID=1455 RepID=UPI0007B03867|nr:RNA methyltransferase [Bacillus badius]KZN98628.1 RNA methyltransferase [Bacillus badius]MED0666388.1 RNA methyltransferase [Bacillus badius]OCS83569.1 RNA methyltransferase [Bacillus badius]OVE53146.1 RNA methyltransferase [Bacillus badius]TDW05198.1 TrmH family RNA methyltransferase [Bacillus badius]
MKFIQSMKNPQVKQWKKLLTKKEREKTGQYLIEGFHLVETALNYKEQIIELMVSEEAILPPHWNVDDLDMTMVTPEIAKTLSDTEAGQGVFAICRKQELADILGGRTYLLVDTVQDPGNMGTMIRTADAAGLDGVILGTGCADPYNPKVLRSAQGSHFHLPIIQMPLLRAIEQLREKKVPVFGTSLQGASDYREVSIMDSFALVVGNEGGGVDKALLDRTDRNVYIPIYGQSESLNVAVAAGILLYHFKQSLKNV